MKLLFDQNISFKILKSLEEWFPNSVHVNNLSLKNSSDREIWQFAKDNDYHIVTFDADFYNFSIVWGFPPKIIWLKTFNQTTKNIDLLLKRNFSTIQDFLNDAQLACLEIHH